MIEELLKLDTQLFLFLNSLGNESWDEMWRIITEKWSSIPLYVFLLYLIYKDLGLKGAFIVLVVAAILVAASDQLANLFKYGVERPRPCQEESLKDLMRFVADRCGRFGYFSAHASSSMGAAVFIGLLLKPSYKYIPFLLLFWALLLGYSRIYLGVHYPLDVITGMLFGGILGWLAFKFQSVLRSRFNG
jgi:undecaprenyl-diphosphatase